MDAQYKQYAIKVAKMLISAFDDYRFDFQQVANDGKKRFEEAKWAEAQIASAERINKYENTVIDLIEQLNQKIPPEFLFLKEFWIHIKKIYEELISKRLDDELAETWFNSVFCDVVGKVHIDNESTFMFAHKRRSKVSSGINITRFYNLRTLGIAGAIGKIISDYKFSIEFESISRDVSLINMRLSERLPEVVLNDDNTYIEMLSSVFYRNKGAYLIGRIMGGSEFIPFVVALLHRENGGIYVDTLLTDPKDVSVLFSFTRSYFMVDVPIPAEFVDFLTQLLPNKRLAEIYASIGFYKHGKTLFVRDLLYHLATTDDKFVVAEGVKGMVMAVITLPNFEMVFKIVKNKFAPAKEVNRRQVREKYRLVKRHDRAGRMADTQEFWDFRFDKDKFTKEALDELMNTASENIEIEGDSVLIKHMWVQRYMTPLNLYIEQANSEEIEDVIYDYGNALKQLAISNIFAGDMLLKNFGVTRQGRVVFYDYDEISYLTEINFRKIPPPRFPEDEMASEPWYAVGANDVFPEEFPVFLFADIRLRRMFNKMHGDLFKAEYWQDIQEQINEGQVIDLFPYGSKHRFGNLNIFTPQ